MLKTRLTDMFGLRYPILSAPMVLHSGGRLAAAVTNAGGLGLFGGVHFGGPDWVHEQIRSLRSSSDRPFGVGFITQLIPPFQENFEVCFEERVPVLAFSFADPTAYIARAKAAGIRTICQVQTLDQARTALAAGADILVAQGNEAGGHTGRWGTLPLLARVLEIAGETPVLAAGGIGDGRTLAAVLAAGADGAWLGTAFLATPECVEVADSFKECIVRSDGEDTVYTEVFDIMDTAAFPPLEAFPWPQGIAGRVLNNRFVQEWHGREEELRRRGKELAPAYEEALQRRDPENVAVYMGQSAAFVPTVRPAAEVVRQICDDAERILRNRLSALLS